MYDQTFDHSFDQEDDISILPNEEEVNPVSPNVIPFFNLTASRQQQPTASGITSMEALRNAYEELKKKYNDLNLKHKTLYAFVRKNHRAEFIDELSTGSHSLDDKNQSLSRKDEIEKLHNAILKLNHELSEEKSKNLKLQMQIGSYKEMSQPTCEGGSRDKSLNVLDDLRKNVEILERSVEIHKAVITKQLPHRGLFTLGKSNFISQRKQQSEHDELSSLGNKSGHSPMKVASAAAARVPTGDAQTNAWQQHRTEDTKKVPSVVDLKNIRLKQNKHADKTHTTLASPQHLFTNVPSSSSSAPQSSSTSATNIVPKPLVRERDIPYLNKAEDISSANGLEQPSLCVSEMLCPICEEPFTDLGKFQEHVFDCKIDPLDRSCPICMANFKNVAQDDFEEHVNTHFDQPGDDFDILNF